MNKYKIVKILLAGVVLVLVLVLAGLEFFARQYREKAGVYLRTQFNQQSDLVLQPFQTSISVWRHFPRLTFSFNRISIVDTAGHEPVQVLFIKKASGAVSLTQLLRPDRLKIARVDLEEVLFYERVDSNGIRANLRFNPKENPDTTADKSPFVVPVITIREATVTSVNQFKKSSYSFSIKEAKLAARFQNQALTLQGQVGGKIGHFSNSKTSFFRNKPYDLNLHYTYKPNQKKGFLDKTFAVINNDKIFISGWHQKLPQGQGSQQNLTLKGKQPLLYIFRQLLPPSTQGFLAGIRSNNHMQFTYRITGVSGPRLTPRNQIAFALKNGTFYLPASKKSITRINLTGFMDNGRGHAPETSSFRITDLTARTNGGNMQLQMAVNNFLQPAVALKGQGRITLPELAGLVHLPFTSVAQGIIKGEFDFKGILPDTLRSSTPAWEGKGAVVVEKANFRVVGLKINCQGVNGELRFTGDELKLQNLSGSLGKQPFKVQASIKNYLAYLFQTPGKIVAQADIFAAQLDTDWLDIEGLSAVAGARRPVSPPDNIKPVSLVNSQTATAQNQQMKGPKGSGRQNPGLAAAITARQRGMNNLQRARSQVNLRVTTVNLPGQEQLKNLVMQVNQNARSIKLTSMQFTTNGGGKANANGGFVLTAAGIQNPALNVKLHYPFINLQQFMLDLATLKGNAAEAPKPTGRQGGKSKNNFFKENDYRLDLQLTAGQLEYLYLKGSNLNLQANLTPQRALLKKLHINAFGGQLDARGTMQLDAPDNNLPVKLRTQVSNVNLQRIFLLAENMKLDVLGSQNIRGTAHCNVNVTTTLDKTFSPSFEGTVAYVQANFKNMELIGVPPLQHALRFLRTERTEHLYFEDVNTSFIMKDNHFITPGLPLNSNLTNIDLSGTYTMGGSANLNFDVNMLNVLFGNNKRRIEKIKSDSLSLNTQRRKQHLLIFREQNKYKVKLRNRREREETGLALRQEFNQYLRQHQIDTVFTMQE